MGVGEAQRGVWCVCVCVSWRSEDEAARRANIPVAFPVSIPTLLLLRVPSQPSTESANPRPAPRLDCTSGLWIAYELTVFS